MSDFASGSLNLKMNWRAAVAELIGTFGLVFFGVGSVLGSSGNLIAVALSFGLAVAMIGTALGPISGGHLNPAVSLGFWLGGKLSLPQALANTLAQIAGGCLGAYVLSVLHGGAMMQLIEYGTPKPGNGVDFGKIVAWELILTMFLMFAVWGTTVLKKSPAMGAWFVGMSVTLAVFVGGSATGASLNPARYLGPAVVSGAFDFNAAVPYIASPILGAALAVILFKVVLSPEDSVETS